MLGKSFCQVAAPNSSASRTFLFTRLVLGNQEYGSVFRSRFPLRVASILGTDGTTELKNMFVTSVDRAETTSVSAPYVTWLARNY